jgi:ribonuclease HII
VTLTVGIDEVGYGPSLGPLVVAAAASGGPLPAGVRIADSKKVFSQSRGIGTLEPAVLGFLRAATFTELLERLSCALPASPWYEAPLGLPLTPPLPELKGTWARVVEPAEFNDSTRGQNKSDFLFEIAADLINRIREAHPGPLRFVVGKQGGRRFYLRGIQERISPTVMVVEETRTRSAYEIPGATIEFLMDAEDRHELVALASMIGKYVRECAMKLFNDWWGTRCEGLRRTAGYGADGRRFYREIESSLTRFNISRETVLRLR